MEYQGWSTRVGVPGGRLRKRTRATVLRTISGNSNRSGELGIEYMVYRTVYWGMQGKRVRAKG